MIGSHVLVGFRADRRGQDALELGRITAAHAHGTMTVATIRPPGWPVPGPGKVDAEWERFLDHRAQEALAEAERELARLGLPEGLAVRYAVGTSRGSGRGLARLVGRAKADVIVIGSAPGGPRHGISVGSTADQLLHGSPVPVMVAPKGYAGSGLSRFERITVAYLRRPECERAAEYAAQIAAAREVPLRLLSLAVGPEGSGTKVADEQLRRVVDRYEADLAAAVRGVTLPGEHVRTEVAEGGDVARAIGAAEWLPGELLVVASSEAGPLRKVFMGDMSLKIVRAAPCPALVLPRAAAR